MTHWYGLLAPASLGAAAVGKLSAAAAKAVHEPAAVERLRADAALSIGSTAAEFASFIALEQGRWQPMIARAQNKPVRAPGSGVQALRRTLRQRPLHAVATARRVGEVASAEVHHEGAEPG